MAYSGEVVAIAAQTDRAKSYPLAVGVGYVCGLVLVNIGLTLTANWLDWTLYTLVRDLRWAAMVLWGVLLLWAILASFSTRGRGGQASPGTSARRLPLAAVRATRVDGAARRCVGRRVLSLIPSSPRWPVTSQQLALGAGPTRAFPQEDWSSPRSMHVGNGAGSTCHCPDRIISSSPRSAVRSSRWTVLRFWGSEIRRRRSGYPRRRIRPAPAGRRRISWQGFTGSCSPTGHRTMSCTPCSCWTPRYLTKPRPIPGRYLLPDETPSGTRQRRHLVLTCQRVGIAILACLLTVSLIDRAVREMARFPARLPDA